jgi:pimeloyl-ACP methyl ester carboxylesterase
MNHLRLWGTCLLLAGLSSLAPAQMPKQEAIIMLKDGFYFRGIVKEQNDFFLDPASGAPIPIPKGFIYVDDHVRRIHFSPSQLQEAIPLKPGELQAQMRLQRNDFYTRRDVILPTWEIEDVSDWNDKWSRALKVNTKFGKGLLMLEQRIAFMTPIYTQALTMKYNWDLCYLTQEFGPDQTRRLAGKFFDYKKMTDKDRALNLARFLLQAGWPESAEQELNDYLQAEPADKKEAEELLQVVKEQRAGAYIDELERRAQLGQHDLVQRRLKVFEAEKMIDFASAKHKIAAQDLKTKYDNSTAQLEQARNLLKELPPLVEGNNRQFWAKAVASLVEELTPETLARLETFVDFAQQHRRQLKEQSKPSQSAEQVLALAITGWLQGNQAADTDTNRATQLSEARDFLLDYLKTDNVPARNALLTTFTTKNKLPIDVLASLVRLLPPPRAYDKLGTEPIKLTTEVPETEVVSYQVQLPPGYSHHRPYPVLVLLHGARDDAGTQLKRWEEQATRYNFILAAPQWSQGQRATYEHSAREHAVVLTMLRDLRRRFQVDSDRVFLFGWEDGANMAFDVGLSHPDQFAGVLPMNGSVKGYPARYWPNAQYLPFYVVEGDRNGGNPKATRSLFRDWIRCQYASIYLEYKGRSSEWFGAEVPQMMNWMSRKKRAHPMRQLGRHDNSAHLGGAEEFRTMRACDNRFYWLSTDALLDKYNTEGRKWSPQAPVAAMQADLHVGNELVKKGANIWSQFVIRVSGVKQVSLWIEEGMIDFTKDVEIRVNGSPAGAHRKIEPKLATMLEEVATTGDRQRLYFARVDVRFK